MPSYSRAVQLAFDRVSDLDSYTDEVLSQTSEWLVVTRALDGITPSNQGKS